MSTGENLALFAGSLVVLVGLWLAITRGSRRRPAPDAEPITVRLRPVGERLAHRFYVTEVRAARLPDVVPVAACGRWPADELIEDDGAPRCVPCEREAERIEHRHQ